MFRELKKFIKALYKARLSYIADSLYLKKDYYNLQLDGVYLYYKDIKILYINLKHSTKYINYYNNLTNYFAVDNLRQNYTNMNNEQIINFLAMPDKINKLAQALCAKYGAVYICHD